MERFLEIVSYESPSEPEPVSDPETEKETPPQPADIISIKGGLVNSRLRAFQIAA